MIGEGNPRPIGFAPLKGNPISNQTTIRPRLLLVICSIAVVVITCLYLVMAFFSFNVRWHCTMAVFNNSGK